MWRGRTVAVTGASGFLGGHLVEHLCAGGARVVPLVRVVDGRAAPGALTVQEVLARPSHLDGVDVLVHAAAIRHRHGVTVADYEAVNIDLTEALLRAGRGRVGRFCLVSSVGVYGFPRDLPITEDHPYAPRTLYAETKVRAEATLRRLGGNLGVPHIIVRPTITYGRGDTNGMLDKLAAMLRSGRYRVVGSGTNSLHHTHVDDMVAGIAHFALSPDTSNEDFIVAGPETTTLLELSQRVAAEVGARLPRVHIPLRLARAVATGIDFMASRHLVFDSREPPVNHEKLDVMTVPIAFSQRKARAAGFHSKIGYSEGLARTLRPAPAVAREQRT